MVIQIIGAFLGKVNILFIKGFHFFYISQFCFLFFGESDERFSKSFRCWDFPPRQEKNSGASEKTRRTWIIRKILIS